MTNYFENLRKRIIWIAIGILCYYFAAIPISLIPHFLLPGTGMSYFSGFSLYSLVSIGLLLYFVYRALFKVDPSLMPLFKKSKKIIVPCIVAIPILAIILPSGLIIPEWERGECSISSTSYSVNGQPMGSTTSQSITGISECLTHCKAPDLHRPESETTCQFRGLFDSDIVVRTPEDFANSEGKIKFNGDLK